MFFVCLYHFAFLFDFFGNLFGVPFFLFSRFLSKYAKCNIEIVFSFFFCFLFISCYLLLNFIFCLRSILIVNVRYFLNLFLTNKTKYRVMYRGDYVFLAVCLWLFSQCNFYFIIYIFFKLNNIVHVSFVPFFYLFVI